MSKRKWRRGPHITSLDELARQEVVYWLDKPTSRGWFLSWQFRMAMNTIGYKGVIFYAIPAGITTRFSDEEIIRAERRLRTPPTLEGRKELIEFLNEWDDGIGDAYDAIQKWEKAGKYPERGGVRNDNAQPIQARPCDPAGVWRTGTD